MRTVLIHEGICTAICHTDEQASGRPLPFGDKAIIQKRMAHSGGLTGRITTLLAQAAELSIRQKTESISLDLLIQAAEAGIFKFPAKQEIDDALA